MNWQKHLQKLRQKAKDRVASDRTPGKAHAGTVRLLHTLRPIGVAMAGPEVVDPYKD